MTRPIVLFLCVHNAGRSQMAAAFLERLAGDRIQVLSAGTEPADRLNPAVIEAMAERGIDLTGRRPALLADADVRRADVVVTMGCGDTCPFFPGTRYLDWELEDPAGKDVETVRRIRDEIERRVVELAGAMTPAPRIRAMEPRDAGAVLAIYQAGLDEGDASFETEAPAWERFDATRLPEHRYVAVDPGTDEILGWVAVSRVSERRAYAGVVEHSVYVSPAARGRGVGALLLQTLVESTEAAGIWTIQSGIFPENEASLALHRRAGFRVLGTRERIGRHHGRWRDVVVMERRSPVVD